MKVINFDMDGTLCDFYNVPGWLEYLQESDPTPYRLAKPKLNLSALARQIHRLQRAGYEVNIISWLSKGGTADFEAEVTRVKIEWLTKHLPSVTFNHMSFVSYGVPKHTCGSGILFDDNEQVRADWQGTAYDETQILTVMRKLF